MKAVFKKIKFKSMDAIEVVIDGELQTHIFIMDKDYIIESESKVLPIARFYALLRELQLNDYKIIFE